MKKFFVIICVLFVFIFSIPVDAAGYTAYSSVTPSTSQISLLIETMLNQPDLDYFSDWVALRSGEQEYTLFYNIDGSNSTAVKLRYYGTTSGYTTVWHFSKSNESNFSYNPNNYSIVGNVVDSLGSSSFRSAFYYNILKYCIPAILIIIAFLVFRIKKRYGGVSI